MKKQYFRADKFKRIKLINELKKIIEERGGIFVRQTHLGEKPYYEAETILAVNQKNHSETIKTKNTNGLAFVLGGIYYRFYFDDNIFFTNYVTKTKVLENNIVNETYLDSVTLDPIYVYWSAENENPTDEEIKEMALRLMQELENAPFSELAYSKKDIRVPNTYNSGYHIETKKELRKFQLHETKDED